MFNPFLVQNIAAYAQAHQPSNAVRSLRAAAELYQRAYQRGRWRRLWTTLTRGSDHLLDLDAVETTGRVLNRHFVGSQTVAIRQIRGSVSKGRAEDFDIDFYPRQAYDEARWKSVAAVWLYGQSLPPIELIQVGETYFVQDGHHRISVARALGQRYIDAVVTVWEVAPALSEAQPALPCPQPRDCLVPA